MPAFWHVDRNRDDVLCYICSVRLNTGNSPEIDCFCLSRVMSCSQGEVINIRPWLRLTNNHHHHLSLHTQLCSSVHSITTMYLPPSLLALLALTSSATACLIATFSWDPCNGNVWGTIVDNDITTGILGNQTGYWPDTAPNMRMLTSLNAERARIERIQLEVDDGSNGMPMSVIYFRRGDDEGGPRDSMKASFALKRDKQGTYSGGWMGDCSEVVTAG